MRKKSGTKISELPNDSDVEIDSHELSVLNNILNIKKKNPQKYKNIRHILYSTGVFFVISLPFIDRIIELALPVSKSWLILIGIKTIIFFLVIYIIHCMNSKK